MMPISGRLVDLRVIPTTLTLITHITITHSHKADMLMRWTNT